VTGDCHAPFRGSLGVRFPRATRHWEGPWKGADDLELATLGWVDWFNQVRIHSSLKYCTPAEVEAEFYARQIVPV
jgi:transposase InsO family protein